MPSLAQRAYRQLQDQILSGHFPAGSVLSEASIARNLGISRTPVGEAIRQLARDGLVRQIPRFGTIVKAVDRRDLIDQYEMREALESFAAGRAAERIRPDALEQLEQYCQVFDGLLRDMQEQKIEALDDELLRLFLATDLAFHVLIVESAGNQRILSTVQEMRAISGILRVRRGRHDLGIVQRTRDSHRRILAAIAARDPAAATAEMLTHIRNSKETSLAWLEQQVNSERPNTSQLPADLENALDAIEQRSRIKDG
jgi:DNA-binding GntR family transcriptional regulator